MGIFGFPWIFNHVNPWIGILSIAGLAIFSIYLIKKQIKNEKSSTDSNNRN